MTYVLAVLGVAIGVAGLVAGQADDSPGLGFLGLVVIVGSVALVARSALRRR